MSAKSVANRRRTENNYLNREECCEWAYSPKYNTVGMRWDPTTSFRIINIYYPMFGQSDKVTDWVSVGVSLPKKAK